MFRNMRYTSQLYAYSNRVCFNRKICYLTTRTITPQLEIRLQFNIFIITNSIIFHRCPYDYLSKVYYTRVVISPEILALEQIRSSKVVTSLTLNSILKNQNISVTAEKLKALLKIEGIEFDLPITKKNQTMFYSLVGKSQYSGFVGVYVFIHKATGSRYVGSSNLLRRRLEYYFQTETKHTGGKFLPLLNRDGLSAFKLKIYKLDLDKFKVTDSLLLEQYMLLDKKYDLNTLRVVNFGPQTGNSVYVYDLSCTILYYNASSRINLKRVLGIHPLSCNKYVDTKIPYLGSFILLSFFVDSAISSKLSSHELLSVMNKKRKSLYNLGTRNRKAVIIYIKEGNKLVDFIPGNNSLEFDCLKDCIIYLKSIGLTIKRSTLSKRIKEGKEFHNFFCKYQEKSLPKNFDYNKIDLLVEEYKNKVVTYPKQEEYKKNKVITVNNLDEQCEKVFFSIKDTINYCETIGIKLDRKSIKKSIMSGENYKGLIFKYTSHDDKYVRISSFLWLVFRDSSLAVLLIFLLIISVAFSEDGVSFKEFETNGNMFEDVIIIPDSELKQTDSREVSNTKVE